MYAALFDPVTGSLGSTANPIRRRSSSAFLRIIAALSLGGTSLKDVLMTMSSCVDKLTTMSRLEMFVGAAV